MTREDDPLARDIEAGLQRDRLADARWAQSVERALVRTETMPQRRGLARVGWFGGGVRLAGGVVAGVAAIGLAVVLVNLPGLIGSRSPAGDLPALEAIDPYVVAREASPPEETIGTLVADGSLWAATLGGQLHRLDPVSGSPLGVTDLDGNTCGPLTASPGAVWVPICPSGPVGPDAPTTLVRADTGSGEVTASVLLDGRAVGQPAVVGGTLWVIEDGPAGALRPIDVASGAAGTPIEVGGAISNAAAGFGSLWLSAPDERAVLRFDPSQASVVQRIAVSGVPGALWTKGESVWVGLAAEGTVLEIDASLARVIASIPIGDRPAVQFGASSGEDIWVLTADEMLRVDPVPARLVQRLDVGPHNVDFAPQFVGSTYAMAPADGWWFVPPEGEMVRLQP